MLAFRLFNVNIPVAFALIFPTKSLNIQQKYAAMYTLIIGLVGTKAAYMILSRYGWRGFNLVFQKLFYFAKVNKLAKK